MRIGNAERSVLVALAHAAVLAEMEQCEWHKTIHQSRVDECIFSAEKKWSKEKLAAKLTAGADIVKSVYR